MKKISIASFIVALVFIVASIALFVLGFLFVNTPQVYSNVGHGYSFMKFSYTFSLAGAINGFMFLLLGGFLFIGGILLLVLAAITHPTNLKKCTNSKKATLNSSVATESVSAGSDATSSTDSSNDCAVDSNN